MDFANDPIKGSRMKFLATFIANGEARFGKFQWLGEVEVVISVAASSCLCECLGYVTATDHGHRTEHIRETLWVRCNGNAPED